MLPARWSLDWRILHFRMTTSQKIVMISVTAGVALLGVLARFLRRRKPQRPPRRALSCTGRSSPNNMMSMESSKTSLQCGSPEGSTLSFSDRLSMASGSIGAGALVTATQSQTEALTVQLNKFGVMGMEALVTVINYFEDAQAVQNLPGGVPTLLQTTAEAKEFYRDIQKLLEMAYTLQAKSELLFLGQRSVLFRGEPFIDEALENDVTALEDTIHEEPQLQISGVVSCTGSETKFAFSESLASALDQVADLRDFEGLTETTYEEYPLFLDALKYHGVYTIPHRILRTELMNCSSDIEYLAKLHCVRLAFQYLFKNPSIGRWAWDTGRQILTDLLCFGDKDTKEFLVGYEDMINYAQDPNNWDYIQKEMGAHNVKAMTFYDICLDFIILDSFLNVDAPPASVTAVVQNRFLSDEFKETALTAAVWSVLKAEKHMLEFPNGLMSHFYVISEQLSPLMAWGFFGPDENLCDICQHFRKEIIGFLADIFSFQKCRYTTIEEFADDVLQHMKTRASNISVKFNQ